MVPVVENPTTAESGDLSSQKLKGKTM